jgi:hypothetical protein
MPAYDRQSTQHRTLCCEEHGDLVEQDLENVEMRAEDTFVTTYGNGVRLLINASAATASFDGKDIPAETVIRVNP